MTMMMGSGHVLVGGAGELVGVDAAFCDLMRAGRDQICGRLVLDLTAPADRDECLLAIRALRETGRSFEITKRFLRDDGSLFWTKNTVSITLDSETPGLIMATVAPLITDSPRGPALLLDAARTYVELRRQRVTVCDPKFLQEPAWDAILAIYVAEAEGRSLDVASLSGLLGASAMLTERWVRALLAERIVEIECCNLQPDTPKSYRLTTQALGRLEQFLSSDLWQSTPLRYNSLAD